ncbi:hypothetical protein PR048_001808 [Dryococelus australis]|uniref:Retrotransposon gag domain-containing protein n=1 Tax=Dryococelus australis TaxID=614101 RepID=A0ABQ9IIC2_9NEOP|nr:hypothetical protein PR048_001808 [Dryococelus australis]
MPLPVFHGKGHGVPERFTETCKELLFKIYLHLNLWIETAQRQLGEKALQWWRKYRESIETWQEFTECLQERFGRVNLLTELTEELYSRTKADREEREIFIRRSIQLYRWLHPEENGHAHWDDIGNDRDVNEWEPEGWQPLAQPRERTREEVYVPPKILHQEPLRKPMINWQNWGQPQVIHWKRHFSTVSLPQEQWVESRKEERQRHFL